MRGKIEKLSIKSGDSVRHSHDPHRLDELRINKETRMNTFRYSAMRLFDNLPRCIKDSDNVSVFFFILMEKIYI